MEKDMLIREILRIRIYLQIALEKSWDTGVR